MQMDLRALVFLARWDKRHWKTSNYRKQLMARKVNNLLQLLFRSLAPRNTRRAYLLHAKRPSLALLVHHRQIDLYQYPEVLQFLP
jgi:hypothetical protein